MDDAIRTKAVADSAIVAADRLQAATGELQGAAKKVRSETTKFQEFECEVREAKSNLQQAKGATPADADRVRSATEALEVAERELKVAEPSFLAAGESLREAAFKVVGAGNELFPFTRLGALEAAADKVKAARDRFSTEAGVVRDRAAEVRDRAAEVHRSDEKAQTARKNLQVAKGAALVVAPQSARAADERLQVAEVVPPAGGGSPESPGVGNHRADHEVIVRGRNTDLEAADAKQKLVVAEQELKTAESELETAEAKLAVAEQELGTAEAKLGVAGESLRKAGDEVSKARDKVPHNFEPTTYLSGTSLFPPVAYTEITHLLELDSGRYPEHKRALEEWQQQEKALSNRLSRREQRSSDVTNHIFNIIGWYAVFLGVVLTAVSQLTSTQNGKPVCGKAWFPVVLTVFGTVVTVSGLYYKFTVLISLEVTIQSEKQTSQEFQRRISELKRVGPQRFSFRRETKDVSTVLPKTFGKHRILVFLSLLAFSVIFSLSYFVILCDLWVRH